MGYHGPLSKGCERCRRRKIKCDRRRPGCQKCEKSDMQCPGYRDLRDVLFRDESAKVARKARESAFEQPVLASARAMIVESKSPTTSWLPQSILYPPTQPINDLAAGFFFAKYAYHETPFSDDYKNWLTRSYYDDGLTSSALRMAIEAVGMAGISNVSYAPHVASRSKVQYCEALAVLRQILQDPVQAAMDTTLLAVNLLGLFEIVSFANSDQYRFWTAHVEGALALLALRGQEQFTRERGAQLYVRIRSQILAVCLQQYLPVPPALVQTTYNFQTSAIRQQWRRKNTSSPSSICEISFRIVNLRATVRDGKMDDPQTVHEVALGIDADLEAWRAGLPSDWAFETVNSPEIHADTFSDGRRHVYPNYWMAEIWNNWRMLRIVVNQIIVRSELKLCTISAGYSHGDCALRIIKQLSEDICISAHTLIDTKHILSLIRPLCVVALEELNDQRIRSLAVEYLHRIGASTGIRQAALLADTISKHFDTPLGSSASVPSCWNIPLMPFC